LPAESHFFALAGPALNKVRINAHSSGAASDLRTFASGLQAYAQEQGDRPAESAPPGVLDDTETYRVGGRDSRVCLATTDSGFVDVLNFETLEYYRNRYRCTR